MGDAEAGGKVAFLVKLPVIREICFRNDAADAPVPDHERGVEEPPPEPDRRTDYEDHGKRGRFPGNLSDGVFRRIQERFIVKEVAAGVGAYGEFRKQRDGGGLGGCLFRERKNMFCMERGIRHLHHG